MIKSLLDQTLAILGAFGSVLTVLGRLSPTWPQWLVAAVEKLQMFTSVLIEPPFTMLGIKVDPFVKSALTFDLFLLSMAIGPFILSKLAGTDRFTGNVAPNSLARFDLATFLDSRGFLVGMLIFATFNLIFLMPPAIMLFLAFSPPRDAYKGSMFVDYWWGGIAFQSLWFIGLGAAYYLGGTVFKRRLYYTMAMLWFCCAAWLLSPREAHAARGACLTHSDPCYRIRALPLPLLPAE